MEEILRSDLGASRCSANTKKLPEPSFSGRSRFCRPALEILKRLILSGDCRQSSFTRKRSND